MFLKPYNSRNVDFKRSTDTHIRMYTYLYFNRLYNDDLPENSRQEPHLFLNDRLSTSDEYKDLRPKGSRFIDNPRVCVLLRL